MQLSRGPCATLFHIIQLKRNWNSAALSRKDVVGRYSLVLWMHCGDSQCTYQCKLENCAALSRKDVVGGRSVRDGVKIAGNCQAHWLCLLPNPRLHTKSNNDNESDISNKNTGRSKETVTSNLFLTDPNISKSGITQWFLGTLCRVVLVFWCFKSVKWVEIWLSKLVQ